MRVHVSAREQLHACPRLKLVHVAEHVQQLPLVCVCVCVCVHACKYAWLTWTHVYLCDFVSMRAPQSYLHHTYIYYIHAYTCLPVYACFVCVCVFVCAIIHDAHLVHMGRTFVCL